MSHVDDPALAELSAALRRNAPRQLDDLYLERRAEWVWRCEGGAIVDQRAWLGDGVAVRQDGVFRSCDGLERQVVADLSGVPLKRLPVLPAPELPARPDAGVVLALVGDARVTVRVLWRRAVLATAREASAISSPDLGELNWAEGHSSLVPWPPPAGWRPPAPPAERFGKAPEGAVDVLLAPQAAAVLVHELFGHPLEGDSLLSGESVWAGRFGERVLPCDLDVSDDPRAAGLPGGFDVDDEGVTATARPLVRAGVLIGALADRGCAKALGVLPGNARRSSVHTPPRPRISNLVSSARGALAQAPREEAAVEVTAVSSGTVEPRSETVVLRIRSGFVLRRGERQRAVGGFTLVGALHTVCDGLVGVAAAPEPSYEPGWCGKNGEPVPIGAVAPWLLVHGLEAR
jgi:hypothetical protein